MIRRLAVSIALILLALPASARAADVSVDANGVLRYAAAPGKVSNVRFTETAPGTVSVERFPGAGEDDDAIDPGAGCTGGNPYVCSGVLSAQLDAGDMSDRLEAGYLDEVAPAESVLDVAVERAAEFGALDLRAYAGTVRRLRGEVLELMDAQIASDREAGRVPTV